MANTETKMPVQVVFDAEALKNLTLDGCFSRYQEVCFDLAVYPDAGLCNPKEWLYLATKFGGEVGEVEDLLGKMYRKGIIRPHDVPEEMLASLKEELGDVMWYFGQICRVFDLSFSAILLENIDKLQERQRTGQLKERKLSAQPTLYAVMRKIKPELGTGTTPVEWGGILGPYDALSALHTNLQKVKDTLELTAHDYIVEIRNNQTMSMARWSPSTGGWCWTQDQWQILEEGVRD